MSYHRQSTFPIHTRATSTSASHSSSGSTSTSTSNRTRQYAHLHAALAQLNAHLADTENLLRMTAVQAEYMRGLAGWTGGLFMAAARVLGEETVGRNAEAQAQREAEGGGEGEGVLRGKGKGGKGRQENGKEEGDGVEDENTVVTEGEGIAGESSVFEQNVGVGR